MTQTRDKSALQGGKDSADAAASSATLNEACAAARCMHMVVLAVEFH
jgi:hypothetical protein